MAVSFWVADPPQLSLFSIGCSKPHDLHHSKHANFRNLPNVVGVEGRLVLLRAAFAEHYGVSEYFLYKAAGDAGEPPSLQRIPSPYENDDGDDLRGVREEFGILPLGDHYLVATLCLAPSSDLDYHLRIYSSERKSRSTRALRNPCPGVGRIVPGKVITLGEEGLLGWVDLSLGLLVCDLHPPRVLSFIPLLELLPGNTYKLIRCHIPPPLGKRKKEPESSRSPAPASWFRDLACVDGVLKFIEIENPAPENRSDKDIIYDSDLIMSLERKAADMNSKQLSFRNAWRVVIRTRTVSSNCWRQACAADVADILVDGSLHSALLSGPKGETVTQVTTLGGLYSAFPILSPEDDDTLYLKSLVEPNDRDGWVAAVDVGNKAVKAIGTYNLPDDFYYDRGHDPEHPFRACTLSRHLDMTPGTEVSACRKIREASWSANHPSNTSFRVCELNSCEPRSKIQSFYLICYIGIFCLNDFLFLGTLELAEKIKRARNAAESAIQNYHISQDHPLAEGKLTKKIEQKDDSSSAMTATDEDYLQCLNKWNAPCYPAGHSLWPHQNNLDPPQQCFSKPDGPCCPRYDSLAPVHGRHNYQPLWQQSSPSKNIQLRAAPQPCFNSFNGASYHGYSQQLSVPNSFAYGAHTGYGNYQHQRQQLPPPLELPISASWQHLPPPVQRLPKYSEEIIVLLFGIPLGDLCYKMSFCLPLS
ncbi:hypothetical protein VPH35_095764 [Triticum aestivum]